MSTPLADKVAELERTLNTQDDAATFWRERAEAAEKLVKEHDEHMDKVTHEWFEKCERLHRQLIDAAGAQEFKVPPPPEKREARTWTQHIRSDGSLAPCGPMYDGACGWCFKKLERLTVREILPDDAKAVEELFDAALTEFGTMFPTSPGAKRLCAAINAMRRFGGTP